MRNYSKNKALLKEGVFMFNSAGKRRDVYGDIHWGSCGQVQVLRGHGNRWQERYLACRTTGTARDKRSEKKVLGAHKTSVCYFFLRITELVVMHEKNGISPISVSIFRFVLF